MLKCQPVCCTNFPPVYCTTVDQISVRQRVVWEYGSHVVYHWRPLTLW